MQTVIYLTSSVLLITSAYLVFNHVVAQDYLKKGQLGWWASTLQLLIFAAFGHGPSLRHDDLVWTRTCIWSEGKRSCKHWSLQVLTQSPNGRGLADGVRCLCVPTINI